MTQQINLYNPIFRRQRKYFSAATMAVSIGLVLAAVIALVVYSRLQVAALDAQAAATTRRLQSAADQLRTAALAASGEDKVKILETKLAEAEARLAVRKQMVETLDQISRTRDLGYSEYLRALARQAMDGVWLTSVSIDHEQQAISITGRALRAELLPRYIDRLRTDPLFKGRGFSEVRIAAVKESGDRKESAADPKTVGFTLRSGDATPEEPAPQKGASQ